MPMAKSNCVAFKAERDQLLVIENKLPDANLSRALRARSFVYNRDKAIFFEEKSV